MTPLPSRLPAQPLLRLLPISLCGFFFAASFALSGHSSNERAMNKVPIHIEVRDGEGLRVAGPNSYSESFTPISAELDFDREYQPGDRILLGGPQRMAVRFDESVPECLLYLPASEKNISYKNPYGREENQTGSAYSPDSFAGKSHRVTVRRLIETELTSYRNLALNPCDLRETEQAPPEFFPHATSNSVSRGLFDFDARNAIDGVSQNGHHGIWPYQSWGPQLRTDIWWKLDFGRPVELDKIRLMIRADFPHDSYWKSVDVEFSDGSHLAVQLSASAEFQEFLFQKRRVSWLRMYNVVPADPAKWCSFIEVEAWGHDLP
jgi:hypothetical protein